MPGGWVEVNRTIKTNTVKDVKEEAGLDVEATRMLAEEKNNKEQVEMCFAAYHDKEWISRVTRWNPRL